MSKAEKVGANGELVDVLETACAPGGKGRGRPGAPMKLDTVPTRLTAMIVAGVFAAMLWTAGAQAREGATPAPDGPMETRTTARATGEDIVREAETHLGKRYDYLGRRCKPAVRKFDCACLTKRVYAEFRVTLTDNLVEQWGRGERVRRRANLEPGDAVFFDMNRDGKLNHPYSDHVGIYSGGGEFIHASSWYGNVVESKMRSYDREYWGARRLS